MFSDESHFSITSDIDCVWVWWHQRQWAYPANIVERQTGLTACIMVCRAIGYAFKSHLVMLLQTLMAQWYITNILCPHMLIAHHPGIVFQQDNAQPQTEHVNGLFTACWGLQWPARILELSIIEHMSNDSGRGLCPSIKPHDLKVQRQQLWTNLLQGRIQWLAEAILTWHNFLPVTAKGGPCLFHYNHFSKVTRSFIICSFMHFQPLQGASHFTSVSVHILDK